MKMKFLSIQQPPCSQNSHTHYTLKRESLVGTLEVPRGVRQMNGVPQSGADRSATAESRVRANWSNRLTVVLLMPLV